MEKPTLPKGTRDFGPSTMAKRQYIFDTIRRVFQTYGFQPLETPSMENLSTLTGKYGEEGDQLLFRILDSGDVVTEPTITVAKATHYLIQSLRYVTYELFTTPVTERYKVVEYLSAEEAANPHILFNWLTKYYATNVLKGRMVETAYYDFDFLIASKEAYAKFLEDISNFLTPLFHRYYLNNSDKEYVDYHLNYHIIDNYDKLYSIIAKIVNLKAMRSQVSEKGLRYDLTVPFARYVVMNRNEVSFPFKRYQIQPVWRADRPQKGRYREFYQCDADVVGTDSLVCEAEIILMINEVFKGLGIKDYTIKINHRGVLAGLAEFIEAKGNESALFVAIDKLDKIGEEKVKEELRGKGFPDENLKKLFDILNNTKGSNTNKMAVLATKFRQIAPGEKGLRDLKEVFNIVDSFGQEDRHVEFDVSLARGLSYYTGCIFEVKINNVSIGSVSGGGRYDNLTQAFGDKDNLSGVGFSFGVDRLYDAMEELQLFPKEAQITSKVLVCHLDDESFRYGLQVLRKLREAKISSEIYPDITKIKKQLDYANKKLIPYTIVIGSDEMKSGELAFKDMTTGEQSKLTIDQILTRIK